MKRIVVALATLTLMVAMAGCGTTGQSGSEVKIVVTTTPLGDMVKHVAGADASVEVLMPVGASPHTFQPSAQQVALIQGADLVVSNGLGLEEGLHDILEAAEADGVNVWEIGPDIGPREFVEAAETGDDHDHGLLDPHFWLDPIKVADAADQLADHLNDIAPSDVWTTSADAYIAELEQVHLDTEELLAGIPTDERKLVTNHRSFGYFSDRYGFEMIGTVIPGGSELANPSSSELAALVETIEREQVPAIFTETIEPDALAQAVAAEVGFTVSVVELYTGSLGEPGSDGDTLVGMLRSNAQRIADALS